jgi:competence protein ComEC
MKGEHTVIETEMSRGNKNKLRQIDVLKAGHHGSKSSTSKAWLDYWLPQETVISAGRNNIYGHPHPTVMQRLSASGSRILRTDRDGEIQYRILEDGTLKRRVYHPT